MKSNSQNNNKSKSQNVNKPKHPRSNKYEYRGKQGRKDSDSERVNFDNARVSKVEKLVEKDAHSKGANEIAWYNGNPTLLKAAGSIPFASVLGAGISGFQAGTGIPVVEPTVPGIMIAYFQPTLGNADAANQSFNSQYSFLVHANSRNYTYNAPDLGILEMAGANVFSALGALIRGYGISKYYYETNRYVPNDLIRSLGFNPKDMQENLATLWFSINNLIDQTRQIWIPTTMPVIDRWIWMNSNVYKDAPGETAQMYAYVQNFYYMYSETQFDTGGALIKVSVTSDDEDISTEVFEPGPENAYSVKQWIEAIQNMIDALISSEDRGVIFGDILNAYGTNNIRAIAPIASDFRVEPIYNAEVLTQFENLVISDMRVTGIAQIVPALKDITQKTVVQLWTDKTRIGNSAQANKPVANMLERSILNFHFPEQPTPEQIMVATRATTLGIGATNAPSIKPGTGNNPDTIQYTGIEPAAYGTEIIVNLIIVDRQKGISGTLEYATNVFNQAFNIAALSADAVSEPLLKLMAFDWHPFLYNIRDRAVPAANLSAQTTSIVPANAYGDYDNYTVITIDELSRLHRVATYSLFGVPQM